MLKLITTLVGRILSDSTSMASPGNHALQVAGQTVMRGRERAGDKWAYCLIDETLVEMPYEDMYSK